MKFTLSGITVSLQVLVELCDQLSYLVRDLSHEF